MVAANSTFSIRGAIWYQGESNSGQPRPYEKLLPAMIADWRKVNDMNPIHILAAGEGEGLPLEETPNVLTPALYDTLTAWVNKHYRDALRESDLADPQLLLECRTALDELTQILKLGAVYPFQIN